MFTDDEIKAALKLTGGDVASAAAELVAGPKFQKPARKQPQELSTLEQARKYFRWLLRIPEEKRVYLQFSSAGQSLIFWVVLNYLFDGVSEGPEGGIVEWNKNVSVSDLAMDLWNNYTDFFDVAGHDIDSDDIYHAIVNKINNTKASITNAVKDGAYGYDDVIFEYEKGHDIAQKFATRIDGVPWNTMPYRMKQHFRVLFEKEPNWDLDLRRILKV